MTKEQAEKKKQQYEYLIKRSVTNIFTLRKVIVEDISIHEESHSGRYQVYFTLNSEGDLSDELLLSFLGKYAPPPFNAAAIEPRA
jgi:hypothetical protein